MKYENKSVPPGLFPETVLVVFGRGEVERRKITEIRDNFVFTEMGGPFCLDDGMLQCDSSSGVRLHDDSLAKIRWALNFHSIIRTKMISAFWAYLSNRAGYTTSFNALEFLTEQERNQFDKAINDIVRISAKPL